MRSQDGYTHCTHRGVSYVAASARNFNVVTVAIGPRKQWIISTNQRPRTAWLQLLSRADKESDAMETQVRTPQALPVTVRWIPDAEVSVCCNCELLFDWMHRKHHCRYVRAVSAYRSLEGSVSLPMNATDT